MSQLQIDRPKVSLRERARSELNEFGLQLISLRHYGPRKVVCGFRIKEAVFDSITIVVPESVSKPETDDWVLAKLATELYKRGEATVQLSDGKHLRPCPICGGVDLRLECSAGFVYNVACKRPDCEFMVRLSICPTEALVLSAWELRSTIIEEWNYHPRHALVELVKMKDCTQEPDVAPPTKKSAGYAQQQLREYMERTPYSTYTNRTARNGLATYAIRP